MKAVAIGKSFGINNEIMEFKNQVEEIIKEADRKRALENNANFNASEKAE